MLKNKNILFFAPSFFNYDIEIENKLKKCGANVQRFDDRPSNKSLHKALMRINPKILKKKTHKYYENIMQANKGNHIDYVFFIKCEAPLEQDLKKMRLLYSDAVFILYLWDSIRNIKYFEMKKDYFDFIYSFDSNDVNHYSNIVLKPLFYLDCFKSANKKFSSIDLCFIGTSHSDRVKIINAILKNIEKKNLTSFIRLYAPSNMIYTIKYLLDLNFRKLAKDKYITKKSMSHKEITDIFSNSKIVIDIQHPKQTGLTMRTIELVGMKKKIITTNCNIVNYDFYNENNVLVIDRRNPDIPLSFLNKPYTELEENIYDEYSIDQWIEAIFKER